MASPGEENQTALRNLKDEGLDGNTAFRDGPRVAPLPDAPVKKNKYGRSRRSSDRLAVN